MSTTARKPRAAIIGAGPAGLAAALGLHRKGWEVRLYERYPEVKAAGNILNLWPAPQKALRALGVDTDNLGAPAYTQLRRYDGRVRAEFRMPDEVAREYNGGFIGLIRWGLYKRMIDALPADVLQLSHKFSGLTDRGDSVRVEFEGREPVDVDLVVGADGVDSSVRKAIWGDSPKRYHGLHLMGGWFLSDEPNGAREHSSLGDRRSRADQAVGQGPCDDHRRRRPPHLPLRGIRRRHVDRRRLLPGQGTRGSRRFRYGRGH